MIYVKVHWDCSSYLRQSKTLQSVSFGPPDISATNTSEFVFLDGERLFGMERHRDCVCTGLIYSCPWFNNCWTKLKTWTKLIHYSMTKNSQSAWISAVIFVMLILKQQYCSGQEDPCYSGIRVIAVMGAGTKSCPLVLGEKSATIFMACWRVKYTLCP